MKGKMRRWLCSDALCVSSSRYLGSAGRIIVGVVIFCALFWFLLYSNEIIYYPLYYDGHGNGWIVVCVLRWGMGGGKVGVFWLYYTAVAVDDIYTHICIEIDEIVITFMNYKLLFLQSVFSFLFYRHLFWAGGGGRWFADVQQLGTAFGKMLTYALHKITLLHRAESSSLRKPLAYLPRQYSYRLDHWGHFARVTSTKGVYLAELFPQFRDPDKPPRMNIPSI